MMSLKCIFTFLSLLHGVFGSLACSDARIHGKRASFECKKQADASRQMAEAVPESILPWSTR